MTSRKQLKEVNRTQCYTALISSIVLVALIFFGVATRIVSDGTDAVSSTGLEIFRMFTILSNCLCAICALLTISFCIEGLKHQNYHMPTWIVTVTYVSTSCVALTFLISVCVLSPIVGFYDILLAGSNLFLHLICPVTAITLFLFINTFHTLKFKKTFIALSPILIYAITYIVNVFILKKWNDYYCFNKFIPWPLTTSIILPVAFGVCFIVRVIHNKMHVKYRKKIKNEIMESYEFNLNSIEEALDKIADSYHKIEKGGDIIIPRMIISYLKEKYASELSIDELCSLYTKKYFRI